VVGCTRTRRAGRQTEEVAVAAPPCGRCASCWPRTTREPEARRSRLEKHGHHVTVAGDGSRGTRALEQQRFDLVLMTSMPVMTDSEAPLDREMERDSGEHLPIIG